MAIRFLVVLCAGLFATAAAHADERWIWTGAYAGAIFGGNSLRTDFTSDLGTLPAGHYQDGTASFGAAAGYGWSLGAFYFGAEVDAQALGDAQNRDARIAGAITGISATDAFDTLAGVAAGSAAGPCIGNCTGHLPGPVIGGASEPVVLRKTGDSLEAFETGVDSLFSIRARLGMPMGRFLPYVTAGVAAGRVTARYLHLDQVTVRHSTGRIGTAVQGGYLDDSDLAFGYSIGAGTEVALTPRLSLRGEYLYSDLGKVKIEMADTSGTATVATKVHQGRIGLVWHF